MAIEIPSFADNALVGALGNAVGLGPLLSQAGTNSTALKPPEVPPSLTERTRDSRAIRQSYPHPSSRGVGPGGGGAPSMNMPGVMSPDVLMHPAVQELLGQYGITPDQLHSTVQNASPNLFLTDPSAFAKHPMAAGMLERALEGAAFTRGGNTVGESISNVAQGMLGAQAARAEKYNNQLMMPFAQAQQVAQLQNVSKEQALKEAQIKYDQAHANYFDQLPELRKQMLDMQDRYHKGTIEMRQNVLNQKLMTDPRLGYLTKDQSTALQQEMQSDEFPMDRFEYYAQLGQQNKTAADLEKARTTATISGGYKVAAAQAGATGRGSTASLTDRKATWTATRQDRATAQKALDTYDKQNSPGSPSYLPMMPKEGGGYMNKAERAAQRAKLVQARDKAVQDEADAKSAYDQLANMATPGAGMIQPKAKPSGRIPTYNPNTGKIE